MSELLQDQFRFAALTANLYAEIERRGWKWTYGDAWAVDFNKIIGKIDDILTLTVDDGQIIDDIAEALQKRKHSRNSRHYNRLAVDLNLFQPIYLPDGKIQRWKYCMDTEDHAELGAYWKSLDPGCTWGGDRGDGNHYSYKEGQ